MNYLGQDIKERTLEKMKKLPNLETTLNDFKDRIKDHLEETMGNQYIDDSDYDFTVFSQSWGDSSLGFGGIGAQMITSAYTVIIIFEPTGIAGVYFNGKFAYIVERPNENFYKDLLNREMKSVRYKSTYEKEM